MRQVLIALALLLTACSPVGFITRPDVPPDRAAMLTIVRPSAFGGGATTTVVAVNGTDVAGLRSGQRATMPIPAGPITVARG